MSGVFDRRSLRHEAHPPPGPVHVARWGAGERVVCIHGSLSWGEFAFREQRPLAHVREVVLPDRRGYGATPGSGRADFEVDAGDIAGLLGESAHLVGHCSSRRDDRMPCARSPWPSPPRSLSSGATRASRR
jgi:hypothetical protein